MRDARFDMYAEGRGGCEEAWGRYRERSPGGSHQRNNLSFTHTHTLMPRQKKNTTTVGSLISHGHTLSYIHRVLVIFCWKNTLKQPKHIHTLVCVEIYNYIQMNIRSCDRVMCDVEIATAICASRARMMWLSVCSKSITHIHRKHIYKKSRFVLDIHMVDHWRSKSVRTNTNTFEERPTALRHVTPSMRSVDRCALEWRRRLKKKHACESMWNPRTPGSRRSQHHQPRETCHLLLKKC